MAGVVGAVNLQEPWLHVTVWGTVDSPQFEGSLRNTQDAHEHKSLYPSPTQRTPMSGHKGTTSNFALFQAAWEMEENVMSPDYLCIMFA